MEWVCVVFSLVGVYFINKQDKRGFYFWIISNIGWIIIDVNNGLVSQAVLFFVYLLFAIHGLRVWTKKEEANE